MSLRRLVVLAVTLVATTFGTFGVHTIAGAQSSPERSTATTTAPAETPISADVDDVGRIVPQPNSGHAPTYDGDRGSAPQYMVMVGIFLVLAAMVLIARRQMKVAQRNQRSAPQP